MLVAMENLIQLSEKNRLTAKWTPGNSSIEQNETADRLAREGAKTDLQVRNSICYCLLAATNSQLEVGRTIINRLNGELVIGKELAKKYIND